MGVHRKFTESQILDIKNLFEIGGLSVVDLSERFSTGRDNIRSILKGVKYDGVGLSEKYVRENANRIISEDIQLQIVKEYQSGTPLPKLLAKYNISRENLQYYRNKFSVPERYANRATTLKSITLQHNGEIKTYPSIESASVDTKIPADFLHKLRRAETFCEGKNSKKDIVLIHDLNRLIDLERASELMGNILNKGTATEKFEWGKELKTLLYQLGYATESEIEINTLQ